MVFTTTGIDFLLVFLPAEYLTIIKVFFAPGVHDGKCLWRSQAFLETGIAVIRRSLVTSSKKVFF